MSAMPGSRRLADWDGNCLVCLLKARAESSPDSTCFVCDGESITFSELWNRARVVASALADRGITQGSRVGVLSHNSVDMLVMLHACSILGAASASLNVSVGPQDLEYLVEHLDAGLIALSDELADKHASLFASKAHVVRAARFSELRHGGKTTVTEHCWEPMDVAWIQYSGATTGRPKGIMLAHVRALHNARRLTRALATQASDRFFSTLQMSHGWLMFSVLPMCLLHAIPCGTTRWFSASRWLDQVREFRATLVDPFLPMTSALVAQPPTPFDRQHPVRLGMGAYGTLAEYSRRKAFEERFGIITLNVYGQSELGSAVCYESPDDRVPGSSGRPDESFQVAIADGLSWTTKPGVKGEILVRPNVAGLVSLGYLHDAEKTVRNWRDLWSHTSDFGYFDDQGHLFLEGREAFWIRRKSENVSAYEVEEAIRAIPGVVDVAVVGVPSEMGDEDIKAFVLLKEGEPMEAGAIHRPLMRSIAFFKVPRFIQFVPSLPRTIKGEIDRPRLKKEPVDWPVWDAQKQSGEAADRGAH